MLQFALIGCGNIGKRHIPIIKQFGKLVAICDIAIEEATKLAHDNNCLFDTNWEKILNTTKPDIAVVCTPNGLHAEHAIQALSKGIHVIVEKPMAITYSDCKKMIAVANSMNVQLWVVKQNRCNPLITEIQSQLKSDKIGTPLHFHMHGCWHRPTSYFENSWHGTKELDGGILYTQFSHFIDLMIWIMGYPVQTAHTKHISNYSGRIESEQAGAIIFTYENNSFSSFHYGIDAQDKNVEGGFTLVTDEVTIQLSGTYFNEVKFDSNGLLERLPKKLQLMNHQYVGYEGTANLHAEWYKFVFNNFSNRLTEDTNAISSSLTVKLIESIYSNSSI